MTSTLHMLQIAIDARRLTKWAVDRRLDAADVGYTCHAILCDAYGDARPQPFLAEEKMGRVKVLGYGDFDGAEMVRRMEETAEPEVAACILDVSSKAMPATWEIGRRYGFKIRVAPTRQGHHEDGRRKERDALLFETGDADREEVYRRWLLERIGAAAAVEECEMRSFRLVRGCRRAVVGSGKRPAKPVTLPEVIYEGVIRVLDPDGFGSLLRNGVGRNKAFGFGALMLRTQRST
jgi:CRISPR system Cascade subunit CasE